MNDSPQRSQGKDRFNGDSSMTSIEEIKMVTECCDRYHVTDRQDGGVEISIVVPPRFKSLWLVRLSELVTTEKELKYCQTD
jgi:hypothetical protein